MSKKTLRGRIALVAVSALGAGLISATSAHAVALTWDANQTNLDTTNMAATVAGVYQAPTNTTDTAVLNYISKSTFTLTTDASHDDLGASQVAKFVITGPAVFSQGVAGLASLSADGKTLKYTAGGSGNSNAIDDTITVALSGAGTVSIKSFLVAADGTTTPEDTFTVYSVSGNDTGAYSAADSSISLKTSATADTAQNTAGDDSGANLRTFSQSAYATLWLSDKYGQHLANSTDYLTATATNGAIVNWNSDPSAATYSAVVSGSGVYNDILYIKNGVSVTAPVSTVVTIALNGVTIATKSVTFSGTPSKIQLGTIPNYVATGAANPDAASISYTLVDAAGNRVAGTLVAGSTLLDTNSGSATHFYTTASGTSAGGATTTTAGYFDIVGGANEGSSSTTVRYLQADGTYLVSDPIKFTTSTSSLDTFTTSLDKTTYAPGEVVTLTVTGKNVKGNLVADGTDFGTVTWSGAGLTKVTADPTSNDKSTDGKVVYKFYASTTEGNYGYSIKWGNAATTTSAQTGVFAVKVSSGGVSNAEVLAAIVKLIASINKQIAALQKALLKK